MASGRKHYRQRQSALHRLAFGWLLLAFAALQFSGLTVRFAPTLLTARDRVGVATVEQKAHTQTGRSATEVRVLGDDRDRLTPPGAPPVLGADLAYRFGPLLRSAQGSVSTPGLRSGSAAQTQARAPPHLV